MGKQIFNKDPIFPQSSKKVPVAYSKLAKTTPPVPVALADPQSAKPTSESAEPTFSGTGAIGVSLIDLVLTVIDLVPAGVKKLSRGQAIFKKPADHMNHLNPLHVKGFINGRPINNMLVDSGASVNLMSYSLL
jgi:hypothetical protein